MKIALFASAALAAALIAAPASAEMAGQVDASYALHNWNYDAGYDYNNSNIALGGAFVTELSPGVIIQVDGQGDLYRWDNSSGDDSFGYAAVHVAQRTDQYSIGVFAGLENYYGDGGPIVGLEGQAIMSDVTFNADVGYAHFRSYNDYTLWDANLGATFFVSDNFAINGALGWESWNSYYDYDGWNGTIGAEYKFDGSPASIFASYRRDDIDRQSSTNDYTVDAFTFGVRLAFGSETLRTRINSGASFTGAQSLNDAMMRW